MLITIRREEILKKLQATANIIEKKQTMAILSNLRAKTEDNSLVLIGTDLEIQLETRCPAEIQRPGDVTFSARKFLDICRNVPENSSLSIELKDDRIHLRAGRSRFQMGTLNSEDYPTFATDEYSVDFEIQRSKLLKLFQLTSFCMANQDVRYYLNGLMINIDRGHLVAVASDGHRLAMYREHLDQPVELNKQIIIPRKAIAEFLRVLTGDDDETSIRFRVSDTNIEMTFGSHVFLAKLIDGKYPEFKGVLSQPVLRDVQINTQELRSALDRVSILSHEKFRRITLGFETNLLRLHADNTDHEQAEDEIDIDYAGETFEISLNKEYLSDAISHIQNPVADLSFTKDTKICRVTNPADPELDYVIMPLM